METDYRTTYRSGNLIGITVKTPELKPIGKIEEIVVDVQSGRMAYGVLCFGGHFGFGEKFFAVPWDEFCLVDDGAEVYFVVDTSR